MTLFGGSFSCLKKAAISTGVHNANPEAKPDPKVVYAKFCILIFYCNMR